LYNNSIVSIIYAQRRLEIKSAHLLTNSDEAVIKCQIIFDPYGDKYSTTIANLTIIKRPEINRKLLPNKISKEVGESLSLNCQASGVPKPFLQWYFNGDRLGINGSHLHIENLDSINFGLYQCEASNAAGVDLTITWLRKGSVFMQILFVFPFYFNVLSKGFILFQLMNLHQIHRDLIEYGPSNQSILIGSNIIMPCKLSDYFENLIIPKIGDPVHRFVVTDDNNLSIRQVGPDNIGLYTCTASNGINEQSVSGWLNIIEKPSMPQMVVAELMNETVPPRIRVLWKIGFDGNSPIIKHYIEMRSLGPLDLWSDWEVVIDNIPSELCCEASIDNLKPSSIYEFRVVAVNRHGPGKPSLPSNNITMPQQPPAAAPRNVAASARSWSSIMVQWQPPPSEQWNGDILGYIVRYRLANYASLPWIEKNISNDHARNVPLEHLITWREYEIQVAAYNDRGMGVFSKPIYVTTLEGVPTQPPRDVKVRVINSTAISVSFSPPEQQVIPGVNQGYKIEIWKGAVSSTSLFRQIRVLPYENPSEVIGDLEKFGHYNVTVLCFTSPGDGPRSKPVEVITFEDVPGAVRNIRFDEILFNMATIIWDPPLEPNGVITKYTIRYRELSSDEKHLLIAKPSARNITIEGLNASTTYIINIQASTKIGAGPSLKAKFQSGIPPILPGRPSSLVVNGIKARNVTLEFVPGFDGHALINKWIVEAKVGSSSIYIPIFNISSPKSHSIIVQGLRPYTKYRLRLIAENLRGQSLPSEPSQEFQTAEAEPEAIWDHIVVEPLSATSIAITWLPFTSVQWNGIPRGYIIIYQPIDVGITELSSKWVNFSLNLLPYKIYAFKMVAENSFGRSVASEIVNATTYEAVPSGIPNNIEVAVNGAGSITVSWQSLSPHQSNGVIWGYRVRVIPENRFLHSEFTQEKVVEDPSSLHVSFSNLRPFTFYHAFVAAFNIIGYGPENFPACRFQTLEDVPGEPSNVSFSYISENEVRLKWDPPYEPNGAIIHYSVAYWKFSKRNDTTKIQLPHNIYGFSATGLSTNTKYLFNIAAETNVGWGPPNVVAVVTTYERNKAQPPSSNKIAVKWINPSLNSDISPLRFIRFEYQEKNKNWIQFSRLISGAANRTIIKGLKPNTFYRIHMRFHSDFGESDWSTESKWIKTAEDSPSSPPVSLKAIPYESSSILLSWNSPPASDWNADSISYRIIYRQYPSNDEFQQEEVVISEQGNLELQYIIKNLPSFRHYIIKMQSTNTKGSSPLSTPIFAYVGFSIPKQRITNIVAKAISSTSISIHWDKWVNDPYDIIFGFKIRYIPLSIVSDEENFEEMLATVNNSIVITDLRKYTEYQVSLSAFNRAGEGQLSSTRVQTFEDLPGPVSNLTFTDILLDSINVSWLPPKQPNGKLLGYIINYRTYKQKEELRKEVREKTRYNSFLATNLEENVVYFFSVKAETSVGSGEEVIANVTTGSPDSPSKPNIIPRQISVRLEWESGQPGFVRFSLFTEDIDGSISAGNVEHSGKEMVDNSHPYHVIGEWITITNSHNVDRLYEVKYRDLQPASFYVFRVFARNLIGVGYPSPESDQLYVPALLPEEPFFIKWWFIIIVTVIILIVIAIVIVLLYVTGSRFKYEKRNSVDSSQFADGGIVSYELRPPKRKNRKDQPLRPNTNTSWVSDCRDLPVYGGINGADTIGMYGSLTTLGISNNNSNWPYLSDSPRHKMSIGNFTNQNRLSDNFSVNDSNGDKSVNENEEEEPDIGGYFFLILVSF
uniref:Down syndrome cell adhesion molecule-like protein Dscam2 n=1 Tax=Dracunculus medinensis TaxID=318479 RepID=A0A158Q594_DRAME